MRIRQTNFASYVSSPYPDMLNLPPRGTSNGPIAPDVGHHSSQDASYLDTVPQDILNIPVSRVAENSLDPWLMEVSATGSPESSRLSTSPSEGIATPASDDFYSPPYPEQVQLPAYDLLEQPQPPRTCSTSHPNWANSTENWQRSYPQGDIWGNQPFVAQPWGPNSYDGYAQSNIIAGEHWSGVYLASHFPVPEMVHTRSAVDDTSSFHEPISCGDDDSFDEDEDSDDEEASDYSDEEGSSTEASSRRKTASTPMRVDKWAISVPCIQQSVARAYACNYPSCASRFVRPEHLRRHIRSKHCSERPHICNVEGCAKQFSRGDNLRDHYWTHLHRGGRSGTNKKMNMQELKVVIGKSPTGRKLIQKLREKLRKHLEKEKEKKNRAARAARAQYAVRSVL